MKLKYLLLILIIPFVFNVASATDISGCTNITSSGTYYLTTDILDSSTSYCINIKTGDVTLNCQGHTISGNGSVNYGIYIHDTSQTATNISIFNCNLSNWGSSNIYVNFINYSNFENITSSNAIDLSTGVAPCGIYLKDSGHNTLFNITTNSNAFGGIYTDHSHRNNISNIIANSNDYGVFIDQSDLNRFINISTSSNPNNGFVINHNSELNIINNLSSFDSLYIIGYSNRIFNSKINNDLILASTKNAWLFNNTINTSSSSITFSGTIYSNDWNTSSGGNYWTNSSGDGYSDTCLDANWDGFCDLPYDVETGNSCVAGVNCSNNTDYLPLSSSYSDELDNCSTYNNTILNFTLKDEEDPTTSLDGDIELVIETSLKNYTLSEENTSNFVVCLAPTLSSLNITKAMIEYSSEGYESSNYSVRNYYLYDTTLYSNSTQDIGLYLLKDTVGENVLFHTTDSAGANYPNVYGKIQRYYVGENVYRTVAMIYTDDQGEALTNLDLLDTWYKFILETDGTVLKNTNPTKITSDEYYFKIYTTTNAFENYLSALNLSYTFTYNSATNITKLEYNSASGLVRSVCLDIENVKLSGRTSIYSHCENSTSATIFYDLTNDTESGKYFAYASVINNNGNKQTLDVIEITRGSSESQNTFGTEGVALTAFGAGTAMFIGIANPIAPIVLGLLTMAGLIKFGFFNLGTATLVSLSTAGGILIYYLRRK